MKIALTITALIAAGLPGGASAATGDEALLGRWRTQAQNGVVEIVRCGAALCGRVVDGAPLRANPDQRDIRNSDPALRTRRVRNLQVLSGFVSDGQKWRGGPLYDPNTGDGAKTGYLSLTAPDTLSVKGCIAVFLCRTQTWKRLPPAKP